MISDGSLVVNGTAYSWGSGRFIFVDDYVEAVCEYSYDEKLEVAHGYGLNKSQAPLKQSTGKYMPGVLKVKGFQGGVQKMREYLAKYSANGRSYGTVIFSVMLQYIDQNEAPIDVLFEGVRWTSNNESRTNDSELNQDEFELKFTKMSRNKFTLYDSSEEL